MTFARRTGCVIIPVRIGVAPDWTAGPLPASFLWLSASPQARASDEEARLNYFESRIAQTLYGEPNHSVRWYRGMTAKLGESLLLAIELLQAPAITGDGLGLAVFHIEFSDDPVIELAALCDLSTSVLGVANRARYEELLPSSVDILATASRASTIAHVTFTGSLPRRMSEAYDAWPSHDQWLWSLASATTESSFPPDPEADDLFFGRIRFSADWQALVLRDGVSFVGLTSDPGGRDTFHAAAQTYVHSIYLDILLLGYLQFRALNTLANQIADIEVRRLRSGQLVAWEGTLIEIRRAFGRDNVTNHRNGNALLDRYIDQRGISSLRSRLIEDLHDSARFVEAGNARSLNAVIGLVSVLGLPLGLSYAAGALLSASGIRGLLSWTGIAVVGAGATMLLAPVRNMFLVVRKKSE